MSSFMKEIDARTSLAGANQMELLLFDVGTVETFGINVFKVREVMKLLPVVRVPKADSRIEGMANIRGTMVPVVDLKRTLALTTNPTIIDGEESGSGKLVITEVNASLQAFHVAGVDRIVRKSWADIKTPPVLVRENAKGAVTAVTMLDDGRMVLILDVEKILSDICPRSDEELFANIEALPKVTPMRVLYVDDSLVARTQIRKTLEKLGMEYIQATNGREGWEKLIALAEAAEAEGKTVLDKVQLVLSDIEMPDMDGFTLTKHIRMDARTAGLPVILHSSLTGTCNAEKGKACGATDYVTKFDPKVLVEKIIQYASKGA